MSCIRQKRFHPPHAGHSQTSGSADAHAETLVACAQAASQSPPSRAQWRSPSRPAAGGRPARSQGSRFSAVSDLAENPSAGIPAGSWANGSLSRTKPPIKSNGRTINHGEDGTPSSYRAPTPSRSRSTPPRIQRLATLSRISTPAAPQPGRPLDMFVYRPASTPSVGAQVVVQMGERWFTCLSPEVGLLA